MATIGTSGVGLPNFDESIEHIKELIEAENENIPVNSFTLADMYRRLG